MASYKVLHWLDTGIFPATVMFSCGFDYDELIKLLKRKKAYDWQEGLGYQEKFIKSSGYCAYAIELVNKKGEEKKLFHIHLNEVFKFTDYEYVKLAHEIVHICQFMLPDILNRDKETEAEAYLHTHLMNQCLKILRNKK